MKVYQMFDIDDSVVGLIETSMNEETLQTLWDEYIQQVSDDPETSLEDFVDEYRFVRGYDVSVYCFPNSIYPTNYPTNK